MEQLPFFVYGTLKPGRFNYLRYLVGQTAAEAPALLRGAALYNAGPYPFLVTGPELADPAAHVRGALITMRVECYATILNRIDDLEDYRPGDPRSMYERIILPVLSADTTVNAWVYVAGAAALDAIRAGRMPRLDSGVW